MTDCGALATPATQPSGTQIHQADAHLFGFSRSSPRIASHGNNCGIALAAAQS
jgi:hypothetical protein